MRPPVKCVFHQKVSDGFLNDGIFECSTCKYVTTSNHGLYSKDRSNFCSYCKKRFRNLSQNIYFNLYFSIDVCAAVHNLR